jgi:hypothetical protein
VHTQGESLQFQGLLAFCWDEARTNTGFGKGGPCQVDGKGGSAKMNTVSEIREFK